jgi:nucleoside-diphosphate-sugar epimerase
MTCPTSLLTIRSSSHDVVTTVRSQEKGNYILKAHPGIPPERLSFVIVEDIAQEGAFDKAVVSNPPFDAVIHTASPFFFGHTDPVKEILNPAVVGTTSILKAIHASAPTVKRVVVTSSFAAMIKANNHPKVYTEADWNPVTEQESLLPAFTYRASKTFAERAAWDYVNEKKPNFALTTLNPPLVLGPVVHYLNTLDAINTSNARVRDLVQGKNRESLPPTGVFLWVDVRDLALAHVKGIEVPGAAGERFFITAGHYSNKQIADVIRESHPELASKLPPKDAKDDTPADVYDADNSKSIKVLGLRYRSLKESVDDTVESFSRVGQ